MKNPCKDCDRRHPGCHARCRDYGEWRIEHDAMVKAKHEESELYKDSVRRARYYHKYNKK